MKKYRILHKIRALRAKRVDAGATEAEATAAAELAAKLMAQYQLDEEAVAAAVYDRDLLPIKGIGLHVNKSHPCAYVSRGVAHLSGCEIYFSTRGLYVIGDDVGRELAHYLFDMVRNVIDAAWHTESDRRRMDCAGYWLKAHGDPMPKAIPLSAHKLLRPYGLAFDRIARRSFGIGLAERVAQRMLDLPPARKIPPEAAARIMADKKVAETSKRKSKSTFDLLSMRAGATVGDEMPICLGVDGQPLSRLSITTSGTGTT